jgi:hypothetical protein
MACFVGLRNRSCSILSHSRVGSGCHRETPQRRMRIAGSADPSLAPGSPWGSSRPRIGETRRILPRHQIERDDLAMKRGRPAHLFEGLARSEPVLDARALQGIAATSPHDGTRCTKGIEVNKYARLLAQDTLSSTDKKAPPRGRPAARPSMRTPSAVRRRPAG